MLFGDIAFRVGALVLALYLSALIFNVCKYLLRVADHLSSVADSIDLMRVNGMSVERGVEALTPHPIDFQILDSMSVKSVKELVSLATALKPKSDKES